MGKGGHGHSHGGHSHGSHGASHAHSYGHSTISHSTAYHPTYHHSSTGHSNVVYSGGAVKKTEDPLALFNNPSCMRKMSWIILCIMCVGLSFIIVFAVNPESYLVGLISFGSIILVYSSIFGIVTLLRCCSFGSLRYFMCPCFMSSFEINQLKSKCQAKHDLLFGTTVIQTDINQILVASNQNNNQFANQENDEEEEEFEEKRQEEVMQPIQAEEYKPQNVQAELVFSAVM
ncbi:Hypothetical_protein [Hexamita inflata]|uniref:Hypothetical_protein n=1 Tax=Hexamita inflata TaxID=28002 RepID=A0AA86TJT3_9EUKA|nr:Hypothetical protein HINF_LOCUS8534 [Hexamita inflata]CAI9961210.1 Hypothetical protein HINF_LOCUS48855 [Hexamita inflata]